MNKIEKRLEQLKKAVQQKPCPYNQFEETMLHADIIKKENLLYMWHSFQEVEITAGHTARSWNSFKRGTDIEKIYTWFNDSFHINVKEDLIQQI